jgi:hypothetical protein
MSKRALAVATDPIAAAAANELLARGNAVDAVVAGVLGAAGAHAGVLFGPVQILVGGAGMGLRAIDGRVRQPGKGAPRPRGVVPGDEIPRPAFAGVPALAAALAAAMAAFGKSTSAQVFGPAIAHAKRVMPERVPVLEGLARRGPSALAAARIADEVVAACGRIAGGIVTHEDLADVLPVTSACTVITLGERTVATVPWGAGAVRDPSAVACPSAHVRVVAAADVHGAVALACYEVPEDGVAIPALGLVVPPAATPVLRGTPRVAPGTPRPAAAPMSLGGRAGAIDMALGLAETDDAELALGDLLRAISVGTPVEIAAGALGRGKLAGVVRASNGDVSDVGQSV